MSISKTGIGKGSTTFKKNHRGTVLTVDDASYIRISVRKNLEGIGFDVIEASSGPEAEEALRRHKDVSIVIMDVMMPGQSGVETLKKIRQAGNQVPILFLTTSTQKETLMEAAKYGISGFLAKPFDRYELRSRVMQIFEELQKSDDTTKINKVLIVDNQTQFRTILSALLEELEYEVNSFRSLRFSD